MKQFLENSEEMLYKTLYTSVTLDPNSLGAESNINVRWVY